MSNKTSNLGLSLVDAASEGSTSFVDWRRNINAESTDDNKSAFEIIDDFAGHIYGRSGVLTLVAANWSTENKVYTCEVADLGATDAIFFTPQTDADQEQLNKSHCIVDATDNIVNFTAKVLPTADIKLNYFISRGK